MQLRQPQLVETHILYHWPLYQVMVVARADRVQHHPVVAMVVVT
jgi:hypothetical protein